MKKYFIVEVIAYGIIGFIVIMIVAYIFWHQPVQRIWVEMSEVTPDGMRVFMTSLIIPLFAFSSALLVIANIRYQARQNFINNFFRLIDQHHKLMESISSIIEGVSEDGMPSKKKDFFDDLADKICQDFNAESEKSKLSSQELLVEIYDKHFHVHQSDLGHYFRNLYHIVNFIDSQPFRKAFKIQYTSILRAQLSNYELVLLSYNCLHNYGKAFYPLVVKYNLNKSINDESRLPDQYYKRVVDIEILKECYPNLNDKNKVKRFPFEKIGQY